MKKALLATVVLSLSLAIPAFADCPTPPTFYENLHYDDWTQDSSCYSLTGSISGTTVSCYSGAGCSSAAGKVRHPHRLAILQARGGELGPREAKRAAVHFRLIERRERERSRRDAQYSWDVSDCIILEASSDGIPDVDRVR